MTDDQQQIDPGALRDRDRREFFRSAFGAAAVAAAGAAAVTAGSGAFAQTAADTDVFNFALNLKYLQAQFYNYAAFGTGLPADQIAAGSSTSAGTAGAATGGRQATFTDPLVAQYAAEIAGDKAAHVAYLRSVLGAAAVAQPAIDIGANAGGAFSLLMGGAGIVAKGSAFDPYANDTNFLLAAFFLEDVSVTALKAAATSITDKTNLENGAGMLGTDAYHAAMIRTTLYAKGATTTSLRTNADSISNVRDALDGTSDDDQGISPTTVNGNLVSNIVPAGLDGLAYSRVPGTVLNIVYLNSASVSKGGFFPAGLNGTVTTSTAN